MTLFREDIFKRKESEMFHLPHFVSYSVFHVTGFFLNNLDVFSFLIIEESEEKIKQPTER